jgi:hypothetical protein
VAGGCGDVAVFNRRAAATGERRQATDRSAMPRPIASGCTSAASCSAIWDWAHRTDSAASVRRWRPAASSPTRHIRAAWLVGVLSATAFGQILQESAAGTVPGRTHQQSRSVRFGAA